MNTEPSSDRATEDDTRSLASPVFICGCPRSGTSLLYYLLLSSGGFAIYRTESRVFDALGLRFVFAASPDKKEKMLKYWFQTEHFKRFGVDPAKLTNELLGNVKTPGLFLDTLMKNVCAVQNAPRWAESTPLNILYIHDILQTFPSAKIIHIVRDGRDVALSFTKLKILRNIYGGREGQLYTSAIYWDWIIKAGLENTKLYPNSILQVKYEDIVTNMQLELTRIGTFIEKELDIDRIHNNAIGAVSKPNTSFKDELHKQDFSPVERWEKSTSPKTAAKLEQLIGPELISLGYIDSATRRIMKGSVDSSIKKRLIQGSMSMRHRMRHQIKSPRLINQGFMNITTKNWDDPTYRPHQNLQYIRSIINGH